MHARTHPFVRPRARTHTHTRTRAHTHRYTGSVSDGRISTASGAGDGGGAGGTYQLHRELYEGEWADGVAHGRGVFLWKDGRSYQGDWRHGKAW